MLSLVIRDLFVLRPLPVVSGDTENGIFFFLFQFIGTEIA